MDSIIIKEKLQQIIELDECIVTGDGSSFTVIAVGAVFNGLNRVKRQQLIYQPLTADISSNAIHALTIKTFTPEEWQQQKHFI